MPEPEEFIMTPLTSMYSIAEVKQLRAIRAAVVKIIKDWQFFGDLDGATFQEALVECGLLREATYEEKRDCESGTCTCREFYADDDYDDWTCWRISSDQPDEEK